MRPDNQRISGFTLIEVLAALVIVSLGMLGVIQAVSQTASNSVYLRDKTLAHWIAMNRLTELRLAASAPSVDESSDEIDYAGRRWRWTTDVTQTPLESMRRIDVRVSLADSGDDRSSLAMVTGFYGSALAPPGSMLVNWDPVEPGKDGDASGRTRDVVTDTTTRTPGATPADQTTPKAAE